MAIDRIKDLQATSLGITPQKIQIENIHPLLSPYLNGGKKQEEWEFISIEYAGEKLSSNVRMFSYFTSPTDKGFHLSNLTGLEIVAQLRIIHIHLYYNLPQKTKEIWFLRGSERCLSPIRDPENIIINMKCSFKETADQRILVEMDALLSDKYGGKFQYNALTMI